MIFLVHDISIGLIDHSNLVAYVCNEFLFFGQTPRNPFKLFYRAVRDGLCGYGKTVSQLFILDMFYI